jgi:hypothetical protein
MRRLRQRELQGQNNEVISEGKENGAGLNLDERNVCKNDIE